MFDTLKILEGDSAETIKSIEGDSVHLVVTSPPYDNLREYSGKCEWNFEAIAKQIFRILKDGGVCCWNVNDSTVDGSETLTSCKQKIFFREQCGFRIHDTMIYEKSNGSKPDGTRYHACMEYIFVLSKGKPTTFNPIRDKKNVTAGLPCFGKHTMRETDGSMSERKDRKIAAEYGMRTNVWKGNTRGQEDMGKALPHPAMMPKWLARDLILSYSNSGDTVLDPFAGSGTVGREAIGLGRNTIMCEMNPAYIDLIKQYCNTTKGFHI